MAYALYRLAPLLLGALPIYAQNATNSQEPQLYENFLPLDIEAELLQNKSATSGPQKVLGYDAAIPFPGTPMEGWTLEMSVAGDCPLNETSHVTTSVISYVPPPMNSIVDLSWSLEATFIFLKTKLDSRTTVDTTCKGILSDECLKSLSESINGASLPLEIKDFPSACREELGDSDTAGVVAPLIEMDELVAITKTHAPGDKSVYDAFVSDVFVTLISFQNQEHFGNGVDNGVPGVLACLRANKPIDNKESANTNGGDQGGKTNDGKDDDKKEDGNDENDRVPGYYSGVMRR